MKKNFDRWILIIIIIIFIFLLFIYIKDTLKMSNNNQINNEVVENIENYDYSLKSNSTDLYKEKFLELKSILSSSTIDEEAYAKLIAQLFIIDFYTLDNKISNQDIGGISFVLPNIRENFTLKASETIYKYVENSLYGNRNDTLSIVKSVQVTDIKNISYTYNNTLDKNAYEIKLEWEYEQDLDYEKSKTLYFVHENDKLYLVEMS